MLSHLRQFTLRMSSLHPAPPHGSQQAKVAWTLGNLLILSGLYLLLYLGGIYLQIDYYREAARGDSDLPAPTAARFMVSPHEVTSDLPDIFTIPVLTSEETPGDEQASSTAPITTSTISRIVIPTIAVDAKVIEVGWQLETLEDGTMASVWQVAEYAVGHHRGSANPGESSNIVLAGHVGGYGKVFYDLFHLQSGDKLVLYSQDQQYLYVVQEKLLVDEAEATPEQRAANAHYIQPTDNEMVTLVTCWPPEGEAAFYQRVIVRAVPYGATLVSSEEAYPGHWTLR